MYDYIVEVIICLLLYPCSPWYIMPDEWLFACSGDATQSDRMNTLLQVGPAALGLGRPGALPAGLVQPCPKPWALIHKHWPVSYFVTVLFLLSYWYPRPTNKHPLPVRNDRIANCLSFFSVCMCLFSHSMYITSMMYS